MNHSELIILSYHVFGNEESDYPFSRTYKQFQHDLDTRDFDWITIDDAHLSVMKACKMMEEKNHRAKVFVPTSLVGQTGYCDWDQLWRISRLHDICNHSHEHVRLTTLSNEQIIYNLQTANELIKQNIGIYPRYFVPPWNTFNEEVEKIAADMNLILLSNRVTMKNDS